MRERDEALRQREETFRRRLNEELEAELRQARREIDEVIADLKARTEQARAGKRRHGRRSRPATRARCAPRRATRSTPSSSKFAAAGQSAGAGRARRSCARRLAIACSSAGWVSKASSRRFTTARPISTSAGSGCAPRVRDLRVVASGAAVAASSVTVRVELQPRDGTPSDLNVVGCTRGRSHHASRTVS